MAAGSPTMSLKNMASPAGLEPYTY